VNRIGNVIAYMSRRDLFSNWYVAPFTVRGRGFNCVEQLLQFSKATKFGDQAAASQIMATSDPALQRVLGRAVVGYSEAEWATSRFNVAYVGAKAKFEAHQDLRRILLETHDAILAEANPLDPVWGCGLNEFDPRIVDVAHWRGENRAGEIVMAVRAALR
jgi:ribA/ribD-fused uncharacterized protein